MLPFGLKPAPRIFIKVVTLLARSWRADGIRVLIYLDDWLFVVRPQEVERICARVLADCKSAHFKINWEKSSLARVPCLTHLGLQVDLVNNRFAVPLHKQTSIKTKIEEVFYKGSCSTRTLSKIIGKLSALRHIFGPLTSLFCRALHRTIACAPNWDTAVP